MDVSIIIVNYNTKELTKNCIDSVFARTSGVSFEVILVDNASTDGSVELFEKDDRIQFIESGKNLGFGKANIVGLKNAKGKYIFFLNSDTILLNNAIKIFFDWMEDQHESIGCCGSLLYDIERQPIHSYANLLGVRFFIKAFFEFYHLDSINWLPDPNKTYPSKVGYITGADLFVRKSVIEQYGAFDPDFFMYYEETEMQYRWTKHGIEIWCIDTPLIIHLQGSSQKKNATAEQRSTSIRGFVNNFRSSYIYIHKTLPWYKRVIIYTMNLFLIPGIPFKGGTKEEHKQLRNIILSPLV